MSCLKKPRDSDVNILAGHPCSSRTNVTNRRENSGGVIRRFLWGEQNSEEVAKVVEEAF